MEARSGTAIRGNKKNIPKMKIYSQFESQRLGTSREAGWALVGREAQTEATGNRAPAPES
jgi:hypothetical protein